MSNVQPSQIQKDVQKQKVVLRKKLWIKTLTIITEVKESRRSYISKKI